MPLTQFSLNIDNGWAMGRTNAPFGVITQGPDAVFFNNNDPNLSTYTDALVQSATLAAGASHDFNLNSFTSLVDVAVTATKAISLVMTTSGPATAIARLTASPTNGLPWFMNGTGITLGTVTGGVAGAANNGAGLIRIQVASTTNLSTGMLMSITGVTGTTEANSVWLITVIDATHFDLQGSTFTNAYTGGGTITMSPSITVPAGGVQAFSLDPATASPQVISAGAGSMRITNVGTGSLVVTLIVLVGP